MQPTYLLGPDRNQTRILIEGTHARLVPAGATAPTATTHVACEDATICAGNINAHTHIYSGLAPLGMPPPTPPPENFVQILERVWWQLDCALDRATLAASAELYLARALLLGTTTLIDHHESPNLIDGSLEILGEACETFGIRACLCYGATERNRGVAEARQGLEACSSFLRNTASPLLRGAVGLHASFTVSDTTIREAGELCQKHGAIMHVHVAEDRADVRDAVARGYAGPLERLIELQALPPGSILAHGLYLSEEQVRRVAENNCWIVQNPRSNHGNQVGYPQALAASSLVALGTDGYPADMPAEADFLVQQAIEHGEDKARVQARITAGNSLVDALYGEPVGLPKAGRETLADLQIRDPSGVRHVFVHGRHVVKNGALAGHDLAEIEARAAEQAARLWQRMADLAS